MQTSFNEFNRVALELLHKVHRFVDRETIRVRGHQYSWLLSGGLWAGSNQAGV